MLKVRDTVYFDKESFFCIPCGGWQQGRLDASNVICFDRVNRKVLHFFERPQSDGDGDVLRVVNIRQLGNGKFVFVSGHM